MAFDEILEFLCTLKSLLYGVGLLLKLRYWIRFHLTMGIHTLRKREFKKHALRVREMLESLRIPSLKLSKIRILPVGARKTLKLVTR